MPAPAAAAAAAAAIMAATSVVRVVCCPTCSSSALRPYIGSSLAGTRTRVVASSRSRVFAPTVAMAFSTFRPTPRRLRAPAIEERVAQQSRPAGQENEDAPTPAPNGSDVPWYLQVEPPRHPTLLHEAPPLPDVPDGSPRLMEPLLGFVSDELGLDDLSLLDLRELDPPPALGPDLLMLFGTARSERHLHVSADRLVRWLRGRGVAVKADGLIGRNELKIKLRRIARKAKLLGHSGAVRSGDDGVTTGWICVNLGPVEGSHEEVEMLDEEGRPTGFGVPQTGTTIVVQMLTESRRRELDLETLWKSKLEASLDKRGLPAPLRQPRIDRPYPPASASF